MGFVPFYALAAPIVPNQDNMMIICINIFPICIAKKKQQRLACVQNTHTSTANGT